MPKAFTFENAQEWFGMSGPWLADGYWYGRKLKHKFLADNLAFSNDKKYVALTRYTIQKKENTQEFQIMLFDLHTNDVLLSQEKYEALFVKSIIRNTITIFRSFHDQYSEYEESLEINNNTFMSIVPDDVYDDHAQSPKS